jgi:predicted flap endonuclease-1-like 5' DNA nuclease
MATFLWCVLGIVLAILIIWLIFRWRRRAAGTLTATHTAAPRQATGDGTGSSEPPPAAPEVAAPEAAAPPIAVPETVAPETVVPETVAPETVAPEAFAPDIAAQEIVAPETVAPETVAPQAELDQLPTEHDSRAGELAAPRTEHSDDQQLAGASTATATLERTTAPAETAPAEVVPDLRAAASALGRKVALDDLTVVDGIGPKISELIHQAGVHTWRALSTTPVSTLGEILVAAGPRFGMHNPGTWPRQAGLLADGQWEQFKQWTAELDGGKERN